LEFRHRRIGDFVNVLNVLWQRFEESQSDGELIASLTMNFEQWRNYYGLRPGEPGGPQP
jgi:hypothetical protein